MPRENVELVRTVYEGWAQGDFRAGSDLFAPDFEWKQSPDAVEPGAHRGAAIGTALRQIFEVWDDYRIEAEDTLTPERRSSLCAGHVAPREGAG